MYKNVLLTIDLNHEISWKKALPTAIDCSRTFNSTLHLLTVVPDYGMSIVSQFFPKDFAEKALAEATKALEKFASDNIPDDIKVRSIIAYGNVYEEILDTAKKSAVDLIVMASDRPKTQDYLLGPNAARVVRHATCSVLVVRG